MNTKNNDVLGLSPELAALLANTPDVRDLDLESLAKSVRELDENPHWKAEYLKGRFVENMLSAMDEEAVSQSDLATKWGKTRQYVSKLLSENKRINFTIETMCELSHLLNRTIDMPVLRKHELSHVFRVIPTERELINPEVALLEGKPTSAPCMLSIEFRRGSTQTVPGNGYDEPCLSA